MPLLGKGILRIKGNGGIGSGGRGKIGFRSGQDVNLVGALGNVAVALGFLTIKPFLLKVGNHQGLVVTHHHHILHRMG
jgi:hypothetical protein